MPEGEDIIIKGGSAEIHFNHEHFVRDASDPRKRKHDNAKITKIEISGSNGSDYNNDFPQGFHGTIKVTYE
jgi:hypothetical protein